NAYEAHLRMSCVRDAARLGGRKLCLAALSLAGKIDDQRRVIGVECRSFAGADRVLLDRDFLVTKPFDRGRVNARRQQDGHREPLSKIHYGTPSPVISIV